MKPGEKVTFILALHGAGSYGNWQRNYFPLIDYKDKYRLVIATPNSPTTVWSEADDEYLHNIVDSVVAQIGKENVKAFWLVGHSQGGMTSNRDRAHRLLQGQGRRLAEPVGRTPRQQSRPRQLHRHGRAARSGGRRTRRRTWRGPRRADAAGDRTAGERFLLHLRNRPARDGREGIAGNVRVGGASRLRRRGARRRDRRHEGRLRLRRQPSESAECRRGDCCPLPAKRASSPSPTAKTAASSPTWCGSTKDTRKGSSRRSPKQLVKLMMSAKGGRISATP